MTDPIRFNVNNYVWIQLTDRGRKLLKEQNDRLIPDRLKAKYPYMPPDEDADGWSRWQHWDLMAHLGPYVGCGSDLPFLTEILIEVGE